jgi:DNA-binding LacI/PurR family transcriptional regulator
MGLARGDRAHPPVMADVARLAGVSHQTVSRVINGHPSVAQPTRQRVEKAIAQLGYRRNLAARALVTRRTRTFGVISVDMAHYGPASTLFRIEEAARAEDYSITFMSLPRADRISMRAALDHLMSSAVEGIIVIAPVEAAVEAVQGVPSDVPLVMTESRPRGGIRSVVVDQVAGARAATQYLLDLGHRNVLHLRGPDEWLEAEARVRGWREELADARVLAEPPLLGDWTALSGYQAGRQIARRADVTAVFAANDQMALGLLRALHETGRVVPDQISVVGFDDTPESAFFHPPLTTVRQDFAEVARRCIALLLDLVNGVGTTTSAVIQPQLVVRASTGRPTADRGADRDP